MAIAWRCRWKGCQEMVRSGTVHEGRFLAFCREHLRRYLGGGP